MLEAELGQSVVVVNRPGAGGEVGHTAIAQAQADGYTIGILNIPPMLTIPITRDAAFTADDFIPVAGLVRDPSALSVHANSPFQTLDELVAFAKENPGAVTVGTTGVGTDDHLAMRYFADAAGIKLTHVPFAGGGPAPNRADRRTRICCRAQFRGGVTGSERRSGPHSRTVQ